MTAIAASEQSKRRTRSNTVRAQVNDSIPRGQPAAELGKTAPRPRTICNGNQQENNAHRDIIDERRSTKGIETGAQHREDEDAHSNSQWSSRSSTQRNAAENCRRG